jgi:NAD-dependent deacetylase
MEMATMDGFLRDPKLVWEWYSYRFGMVDSAQPNPGHYAIAELERQIKTVTVVTQNIDGLHQRAGSSDVVELHGSIRRYRCISDKHTGFTRADIEHQPEMPPKCPECGDLLRPEVVWFGEMLPAAALERAFYLAEHCHAMIVVGTTGEVQPASTLPLIASQHGATIIDVNPNRNQITPIADIFLQGPGGEVLPQLVAQLQHTSANKA